MKSTYVILSVAVLALVLMVGGALAGGAKEYSGTIVDGMCYGAHKDKIGEFVAGHTKECVLKPGCRDSGMYLYQSDGTALKFDAASSAKIVEFLEKEGSTLKVAVSAEKMGEEYRLVSIKNK